MDLDLEGRTVLITGGSRGIGYAAARIFAAEGCNLHLASRSASDLRSARGRIIAEHRVDVSIHPLDMSVSANAVKLAKACGPVDILVNNAGAIPQGTVTSMDEKTWRKAWDLKVFGFINLTRQVYPGMCARKRGVIVNVVGIGGERPTANYLAGSMANSGLMTMSRALGAESVEYGVRVFAVNPGAIETDRSVVPFKARAKAELGDENRWRELTTGFPFRRLGTADELASVVVFLASDRGSYVSGTVVTVDGGATGRNYVYPPFSSPFEQVSTPRSRRKTPARGKSKAG